MAKVPKWLLSGNKYGILHGLTERPDLDGAKVRIEGRDESDDRWHVTTVLGGEDIKVRHENIEKFSTRRRNQDRERAAKKAEARKQTLDVIIQKTAPATAVLQSQGSDNSDSESERRVSPEAKVPQLLEECEEKRPAVQEEEQEKRLEPDATDEPVQEKRPDDPNSLLSLVPLEAKDKAKCDDALKETLADFWGDDEDDKKGKKKKKRKKDEVSTDDELMEDEGEGEPGAVPIELTTPVLQQLLADNGRWMRHFEKLIMKLFGIASEIEISDAHVKEESPPMGSDDDDDEDYSRFWKPGLHFTVAKLCKQPLRRLNGRLGRLVRRDSANSNTWHVRLADGTDESLDKQFILPRQVDDGEAWLRLPKDILNAEAVRQLLQLFVAAVGCETLRSDMVNECEGVEVVHIDIPTNALGRIRGFGGKSIMTEFGVICVVSSSTSPSGTLAVLGEETATRTIEEMLKPGQVIEGLFGRRVWRDAEVIDDRGQLVKLRWGVDGSIETLARVHIRHIACDGERFAIYGNARACVAGRLRAMAFMEDCAPGFHSIERLPQATDRLCHLPADPALTPRHIKCIASVTGAIVERVGKLAFVAGEREECLRAQALLTLFDTAATREMEVEDVPAECTTPFTNIRVPVAAAEAVSIAVDSIMGDTCAISLWLTPKKSSKLSAKEELLMPGVAVSAEYEGEWHDATIVKVDIFNGNVEVKWAWDESSSTVAVKCVKPKLKKAQKMDYQRKVWLRSPWEVAIFGSRRMRTVAALRVMACTDSVCPGLWSSELLDCMDELRSKAGDVDGSEAVGFEVYAFSGEQGYPMLAMLLKQHGRTCIRRASRAANCFIEIIGSAGLFLVGTVEERTCGFNLLRWILQDRAAELMRIGFTDYAEYAKTDDRSKCSDVTTLDASCNQCAWIDPDPLRKIERATSTVILLDHGPAVPDCDWDGDAPAAVHICGIREEHRQSAASKVQDLIKRVKVPVDLDVQETPSKPAQPSRPSQQTHDVATNKSEKRSNKKAKTEDASVATNESEKRPNKKSKTEAASVATNESEESPHKKTKAEVSSSTAPPEEASSDTIEESTAEPLQAADPREEIRKLARWPVQVQDWRAVQDTVWRGHPALSAGWIRLWSRSKDCVYYYKLQDGTSSYSIGDALL